MLKTKLGRLVRFLSVGLFLPLFHLSAVTVEVNETTKFSVGGLIHGMYAYQDNAFGGGNVYKPGSAKRQTSVKDTKARGGFRDEFTRLNFVVSREAGEKVITGKIEWEFDGTRSNSMHGVLDYRIAALNIKFDDKFDLTVGRNWDIFGNGAGPYTDYIATWTWGGGQVSGNSSNQILGTYKVNDNLKVQGMLGGGWADRETTVNGDFNQQPSIMYALQYKQGKGTTDVSGFYQRKVGSRPDLFNDQVRIRLDSDTSSDNITYRVLNQKTDGSDGAVGTACPSGWVKSGGFCQRSRPLFYDGSFASTNAYFLYLPDSGVDRMGYDYDSVGYSLAHELELDDKNRLGFVYQTGVNMGYSGWDGAQRFSVLDEVNGSLLGQMNQMQRYMNGTVYKDITGKDILGSVYQTKSILTTNVAIKSKHKLSEKSNFYTWFGRSMTNNPKNVKPNNGFNDVSEEGSLKRATYLAFAGSSGGTIVENTVFKFTFDHTPFKGEVDNLVFFTTVSHVQTKYANTEVQDAPVVSAIFPFMNKPDSAYDAVKTDATGNIKPDGTTTIGELTGDAKDKALKRAKTLNDEARDTAFRNALRRSAAKTAIASDITIGVKYSF